MKSILHTLILSTFLPISAFCENWPGFEFKVESSKEEKTEKKTVWVIQISSDDPLKDTLRITFKNKNRKVTEVVWMTKEMHPLITPSIGVHIPVKPSTYSKPIVILSEEKLKEIDYSDIALVNFIWEQPNSEPVETGN